MGSATPPYSKHPSSVGAQSQTRSQEKRLKQAIFNLMESFHFNRFKDPESKFNQLIQIFGEWVNILKTSPIIRDNTFLHNVCRVMVNECYSYKIWDSDIVAGVLRSVYDGIGHFQMIYNLEYQCNKHADPVTSRQHDTNHRCGAFEVYFGEKSAVVYFLYHAMNEKLLLNGSRFTDISDIDCDIKSLTVNVAESCNPQLLLLLLRYGATVQPVFQKYGHGPEDFNDGISVLLLSCLRFDEDDNSDRRNASILCVKIILRSVPQLQMNSLEKALKQVRGYRSEDAERFFERMSSVLPEMKKRHQQTSTLKHLARCAVRKQLGDCWQLPKGIAKLSVPQEIKPYLDLFED